MPATGLPVRSSVQTSSVSKVTRPEPSATICPSRASMTIGIWSQPYFSTAVMSEVITEIGPAWPRARYQSCTMSRRPALPRLWSRWPMPVVLVETPPML
ncbi:MAG TPA: hypothetical protein VGC67_18120 [Cellulomonas sp.]